jgi:hypothetical protein
MCGGQEAAVFIHSLFAFLVLAQPLWDDYTRRVRRWL